MVKVKTELNRLPIFGRDNDWEYAAKSKKGNKEFGLLCQTCNLPIEFVKDGWLEWRVFSYPDGGYRDYNLVHWGPACPFHSLLPNDCYTNRRSGSPLIYYVNEVEFINKLLTRRRESINFTNPEEVECFKKDTLLLNSLANFTPPSLPAFQRKSSLALRFDIFKRDGYCCQICGISQKDGARLEVDHKIPRSKGGKDNPENLWTLCFNCNRGKQAKYL